MFKLIAKWLRSERAVDPVEESPVVTVTCDDCGKIMMQGPKSVAPKGPVVCLPCYKKRKAKWEAEEAARAQIELIKTALREYFDEQKQAEHRASGM